MSYHVKREGLGRVLEYDFDRERQALYISQGLVDNGVMGKADAQRWVAMLVLNTAQPIGPYTYTMTRKGNS